MSDTSNQLRIYNVHSLDAVSNSPLPFVGSLAGYASGRIRLNLEDWPLDRLWGPRRSARHWFIRHQKRRTAQLARKLARRASRRARH